MKVITEERLKELLPWPEQDQDVADGLNLAIEECEEIDTLTVSKLRPMSEAPRAEGFLVKLQDEEVLHEAWYLPSGMIQVGTITFKELYAEGWIPMLRYKPEQK